MKAASSSASLRLGSLSLLLALLPLASHSAADPDNSVAAGLDELMASARYWQRHQRSDLARGVIDKILTIDPQHRAALVLKDQLEGRTPASPPSPIKARSKTQPSRKPVPPASKAAAPLATKAVVTPTAPAVAPPGELSVAPEPELVVPEQRTSPTAATPLSPPPPFPTLSPTPSPATPERPESPPAWKLTQMLADLGWRSASSGTSSLNSIRAGLKLSQREGPAWFSLERLVLDAGRYRTPGWSGNLLGQAPLSQPADSAQNAAANLLAAGTRIDLGAIEPDAVELGWHDGPLPDLSGRWSRTLQRSSRRLVELELVRRPMTGTLLSWLGATDPVSGQRWGAVSQNALTLSLDDQPAADLSASLSLRLGTITGHGVRDNPHLQLRATLDRPLQRQPDWQLDGGLVGTVWSFVHNESFSTWGQGGYWSPQRYVSLGGRIKLQTGLGADARLEVQAGLSRSFTAEDDSPWYPTDAALQAAAGNPMHAGGPGGGIGGSLQMGVEKPLTTGWFSGWTFSARLELERSSDYSPNRVRVGLLGP
jgi:hypothetical protein